MNTHEEKSQENNSRAAANKALQKKRSDANVFTDNRAEAAVQRNRNELIDESLQVQQYKAWHQLMNKEDACKVSKDRAAQRSMMRNAGNEGAQQTLQARWLYNHLDHVQYWEADGTGKSGSGYDYTEIDQHEYAELSHTHGADYWTDDDRFEWMKEYAFVLLSDPVILQILEQFDEMNQVLQANVQAIRGGGLSLMERQAKIQENMRLGPQVQQQLRIVNAWLFTHVSNREDLAALTTLFLRGELPGLPYVTGPLSGETDEMLEGLIELNETGTITYESQPSGQPEEQGGATVSQQAFISFSLTRAVYVDFAEQVRLYNEGHDIKLGLTTSADAEPLPLKVAVSDNEVAIRNSEHMEGDDGKHYYKVYTMANSPVRYLNTIKGMNDKVSAVLEDEVVATIYFDSFKPVPTGQLINTLSHLIDLSIEM